MQDYTKQVMEFVDEHRAAVTVVLVSGNLHHESACFKIIMYFMKITTVSLSCT